MFTAVEKCPRPIIKVAVSDPNQLILNNANIYILIIVMFTAPCTINLKQHSFLWSFGGGRTSCNTTLSVGGD